MTANRIRMERTIFEKYEMKALNKMLYKAHDKTGVSFHSITKVLLSAKVEFTACEAKDCYTLLDINKRTKQTIRRVETFVDIIYQRQILTQNLQQHLLERIGEMTMEVESNMEMDNTSDTGNNSNRDNNMGKDNNIAIAQHMLPLISETE
ncbi:hypothetical protein DINM_001459 [Dirofilaria immitis]|nr:hypothetical protein [Dirofilaria immitis]